MNRSEALSLIFFFFLIGIFACAGRQSYYNPEKNAQDPNTLVSLAQKHFQLAFQDDAHGLAHLNTIIDACEEAISLQSDHAEAHFYLGYALAFKGMIRNGEDLIEKGMSSYQQAITLKASLAGTGFLKPLPYFVATHLLGADDTDIADLKRAAAMLQQSIRLRPDASAPHLFLSHTYDMLGKEELALQEAIAAAELAPDEADTQWQLGSMYYQSISNRETLKIDAGAQKAIKAFQAAVRINPEHVLAIEGLAIVYGTIGQYELKAFTVQSALAFKNTATLQYELGQAYLAQGNLDRAEDCYREALAADPKESLGLRGLAHCQYLKGEYSLAEKTLAKWMRMEREPSVYMSLLYYNTMLGKGDPRKGQTHLEKLYEKFRGDAWEKALLEYYLEKLDEQGLLAQARQSYDRGEACFYIACRYWHAGNREKAAVWFKQTVDTKIYDYSEYLMAQVRLTQFDAENPDNTE